jgi:hypothetical protein
LKFAYVNASVSEINDVKNISRQGKKERTSLQNQNCFANFSLLGEVHFMLVWVHLPHFCGNKCIDPLCINQIIIPIDPYFGKVRTFRDELNSPDKQPIKVRTWIFFKFLLCRATCKYWVTDDHYLSCNWTNYWLVESWDRKKNIFLLSSVMAYVIIESCFSLRNVYILIL